MSGSRSSNAVRIAAELLVVFVGVLIALAADSWWEHREERARLDSNLEALALDMTMAQDAIAGAIEEDSATVVGLAEAHQVLLSDLGATQTPIDLPEFGIRIPPIPLGTLRLLVSSGEVRLIDDDDLRAELIEGLSKIELYQGWMNDLATDGRRASEELVRAENESLADGRDWPRAAYRNADVLTGITLVGSRIENILTLLRRIRGLAEDIEDATREELEST